MADIAAGGRSTGIAFLVGAGLVYEIVAAACSSPQTTEINATARAGTLMKWVNIGLIQGAAFVVIAAILDPRERWAMLGGGGLALVTMWASYAHAKSSGLRHGGPGTESY